MKRLSPPGLWLVLASSLAVTSAFGHSAVEAAPRPEDGWKRRHESMNARVKELGEKSQVIFIGDSITQGWEGEGKEVWAKYYAGRNAINLGIGGDRTQHVLWRLRNGNLSGLKPKAAVLMIGTNNSNGEDNTVEQIADGVAAIVQELRTALPGTKVLLVPIFPRSENPSPQRGKVLQVNQIIQKLADEKQVFWVDFGHRFLASNGTIPRDLMPDFLHLSPKAYGIWAESLEPRLAAVLGDTPVAAAAQAGGGASLSGAWMLTVPGRDQEPVEIPMALTQEGDVVTGTVDRPNGQTLAVEKGVVRGNEFSWTLRRKREDGSTMVYAMTGKLEGGRMEGKASTDMAGQPMTISWTAKRR